MKATKKIFSILVIMMTLIFCGMNITNAQYLAVDWSESDSCECPNLGNYTFRIDVVIIDECGEEWHSFYVDTQFVNGPIATFATGYSCLDYTLEPCYLIITDVKKICSDGHGGFVVVCSEKNNKWVSCHELMYHTIPIDVGVLN